MRIELKCACGATAIFDDEATRSSHDYSQVDALRNPPLVVVVQAEQWRAEHTMHASMVHNQGKEMPL